MMRGAAGLLGLVAALAAPPLWAQGPSEGGEYRWRMWVDAGTANLHTSNSEATDHLGPVRFSCVPGSDEIKVTVELNEDNRKAIANILRDNTYPEVIVVKSGENERHLLDSIDFSELHGWAYHFHISERSPAMDELERVGSFRARLGKVDDGGDLGVGLDAVRLFRRNCRNQALPLRR